MNQTRLDEINQIVSSAPDVQSFYKGFLSVVLQASDAQLGVAWNCTQPPFRPICQIHPESAEVARLPFSEKQHMELLDSAIRCKEAMMVQPKAGGHDQPVLMFGPIRRDSEIELVEIVLPPGSDRESNKNVLEELNSFCKAASQFSLENSSRPNATAKGVTPDSIDQYAHQVHRSLDYKTTAANVANEARRFLDCDRVSVLLQKGRRSRLLAISGQPSVNRRSNNVTFLERLAERCLATGEPFWYPASDALPPQITEVLDPYMNLAATRSLAVIPVFEQPQEEQTDPNGTPISKKVIGGIVIEECSEQWNRQRVEPAINVAARHGSDAFRNSLGHKSLFLYPLWKLLGNSRVVATARNLPKTLMALGAFALFTLLMIFVPASFTLNCDGVLIPETRRNLFAEMDCNVKEIVIDHGSVVAVGDSLIKLSNDDLDYQIEQVIGELEAVKQRLASNRASKLNNRTEDRQMQESNMRELESQIQSLKRRHEKLLERSEKLDVKSPIDGEVITWDVREKLNDRPVKQGQLLVEVAKVDGKWLLELDLPDRRIAHLLRAEKESEAPLKVTYQLAADPNLKFEGEVVEIARATSLTNENTHSVRVKVAVNEDDLGEIRQARSGVSAKIHCGKRSLGYVWFNDVAEFVKSRILFRIW